MKLCIISNLYPPYVRGGAERIAERLAEESAARGDVVHVITSAPFSHTGFGDALHVERGVHVHRLFHSNVYFNLYSSHHAFFLRFVSFVWTEFNFVYAFHVWKLLREIKPDVIHTHNLAGTSFLIPRVIKLLRIPHIHTVHDIQLAIPSGRLLVGEEFDFINSGALVLAFQWLQRKLWGSPRIITAPSEWLLSYYRTRKYFRGSRFQLVRHFFPPEQSLALRDSQAHIKRPQFTLVYVGQMERAKGVIMLVQLFGALCTEGLAQNAELIFVGTGADEKIVATLAAPFKQISVLGHLHHDEVEAVIRSADVVLVPSLLYENSPTIVVEALAAGRPLVVSDVGGAAELVRATPDGGFVVEPNETAWREQLAGLLQNPQTVLQMNPQFTAPSSVLAFHELYVWLNQKS